MNDLFDFYELFVIYEFTYHYNGQLCSKTPYLNSQIHGIRELYYDNGILLSITTFIIGKTHGTEYIYNKNGVKMMEIQTINGQLHGFKKIFYPNGTLQYHRNYKYGSEHGSQQHLYEDGSIYQSYNCVNGVREGLFLQFHSPGIIHTYANYVNGKMHGQVLTFYPNNQIKENINYLNGVRHGLTNTYEESGEQTMSYPYENGKVNGMMVYFTNGFVDRKKLYKDGMYADYIEFYINEILDTKLWVKDNKPQYKHRLYPSGALRSTTQYKGCYNHGIEEFFNEDGTLQYQILWNTGVMLDIIYPLVSSQDGRCDICYESVNYQCKLPCSHLICQICLIQIKNTQVPKCPYCRFNLTSHN